MRRLLAMRQAVNFERWLNRLGVVEMKGPASNSLTGRLAVKLLGFYGRTRRCGATRGSSGLKLLRGFASRRRSSKAS